MSKKVFAFDLGKASIGYCARDGFNILELGSIIIDKDHGEVITNRDRRRVNKTLSAHKAREKFFNELWQDCNLKVLEKTDKRFTIEFASKNDDTIYNSTLLRIALLQNQKLSEWQIYKALHNAIQRRGYDAANLAWANVKNDDDKKNKELSLKYTRNENGEELIKNEQYKYPCYYDATKLRLWNEKEPNKFAKYVPLENVIKVRDSGIVAPRQMVEKELKQLFLNAQKQIPELQKYSVEYFLYGEYEQAYGSYYNPKFQKYRGRKEDWQGVLGQKIPRFDNRIIAKCKLLPKRNVCRADKFENVSLVLLMKLKNLRLTTDLGEKCVLSPDTIKEIYNNWIIKAYKNNEFKPDTTIIKKEIQDVIEAKILDKIEPMKANISGRSSFCTRACKIMIKIITEGIENPLTMDISEFVDKSETQNPITQEEIKTMLAKIGNWDNLYIPDNRYERAEESSDDREKTDILIGNITNPIVRNRLQIFRDNLLKLKQKHGTPDEVIFEFVRDGADKSLLPGKKAQDILAQIKKNENDNEQIAKELKNVDAYSLTNFDKLKLVKMQNYRCIYSGEKIAISDLDKCEIDHIYPRTMGGNDALYNKVLCYSIENQKKKGRTPYEWLHDDEKQWFDYVNRLETLKDKLGKKKYQLLTSKPEDCEKLIESYNGLAETAQIARVAQEITAFVFGWGMQTVGDNRHIFVNNGSSTAAIRRRYGLNKLLGDDVKKNRDNDKHHALDAICISFSRDFKYDEKCQKDTIEGFTFEFVKQEIDQLMPYPYTNDKPFKGNTKPLETIYGYRKIKDEDCITQRISLENLEQKEKKIKTIVDEDIKNDLLNKLEEKMTSAKWSEMLKSYIHPKKQTKVKKVLVVVSTGEMAIDTNGRNRVGEYTDFGNKGVKSQFKHSKGHKGQIIYYDEKGKVKVMPIYANIKTQDVIDKLQKMGCKLYKNGMMFSSGCLVDIPKEFKAGSVTYPSGIYKLRTIKSAGGIVIEDLNGIEISTRVATLTNIEFKKYQKHKK